MSGVLSGDWTVDGRRKAHQDQMVCGSVDKALPFPFPLPATNLAKPSTYGILGGANFNKLTKSGTSATKTPPSGPHLVVE
jgi:hypothetical protein